MFAVTRTGSLAAPLVVRLWLDAQRIDGNVTAGIDCEPMPLAVTIPAGQAVLQVPFVPRDDSLVEGDETATLRLVASDAYTIDESAHAATVALVDDDAALGLPTVTMVPLDATAAETGGDPGAVRIVRTGATAAALQVNYEVAGSATSGVDYTPLPGTVTIAAGSVASVVIVHPLQDTKPEAGETVVLRLAAASNYARGAARSAHVVIADDDRLPNRPIVGVLGTMQGLAEPATDGAFTITRTGFTNAPLLVHFAVTGTATAGADYVALPTSATIPVGAAWVRVPIVVIDDALVEGPESLVLTVLPDPAYAIGRASAQELWMGDDEAPTPAASEVQLALGPLAVGQTGSATVVGGAPNGFVTVWIGLLPGYLPVAPFGVFGLDPVLSGPFATGLLDATGSSTMPLVMPASTAFVGLATWWQAFASTGQSPFAVASGVEERVLVGF